MAEHAEESRGVEPLTYHQRTKHGFEAYAKGPETIDWDAQPDHFRRFAGAPVSHFSLVADHLKVRFGDLLSPDSVPELALDASSLGLLLEVSLALSAWKQYGAAKWSLRCNPSSGNLHPTEAYLVCRGVMGLADGVYHYRPDLHGLEQRCVFSESSASPGGPEAYIGLASVHWREAWKYGERAFRYCQHDVGHAVAALGYAAAALGWQVEPCGEMGDRSLAALLGLDRAEDFIDAETEAPELLLRITPNTARGQSRSSATGLARPGTWQGKANVLDPRHLYSWPLIDDVARSCERPDNSLTDAPLQHRWPEPLLSPCTLPAATLIRRRRSAQAFDGSTTIETGDFYRMLDHLLPRPQLPPWGGLDAAPALDLVLFLHRVNGLKPGLYYLARSAGGEAPPDTLKDAMREEFAWRPVAGAPDHLPLYCLINARAERTAAQLSCRQPIAGTGAFSLGMIANLATYVGERPWRYRELFWEAGAIGQALYLEAEACGLQGTGIGCYFDDPVINLLGLEGCGYESIYHFTVGGAVVDARLASLPPYHHLA